MILIFESSVFKQKLANLLQQHGIRKCTIR